MSAAAAPARAGRKPPESVGQPSRSFFAIPNAVTDKLLRSLEPAELKCYLIVLRETGGRRNETAQITPKFFAQRANIDVRTAIMARKSLREMKLVSGERNKFSPNYDESTWDLKLLALRKLNRGKDLEIVEDPEPESEPAPAPAPALVAAECPKCGFVGDMKRVKAHAAACADALPAPLEGSPNPAGEQKAKDELEFTFAEKLSAYLRQRWLPVIKELPSKVIEKTMAAVLGETPLDWYAERLEKRAEYIARNGWPVMLPILKAAAQAYAEHRAQAPTATVSAISEEKGAAIDAEVAAMQQDRPQKCPDCGLRGVYPSIGYCKSAPCLDRAKKAAKKLDLKTAKAKLREDCGGLERWAILDRFPELRARDA